MKGFYCFIILVFATICQGGVLDRMKSELETESGSDSIEHIEKIRDVFQKQCEKVGHKFSKENFDKAIENATACLKPYVPQTKDELKDFKEEPSFCEKKKRVSMRKCFEDVIHIVEECIEEKEEKYFPDFIFTVFDGLFDMVCEDEGKIFEDIFDAKSFDCIETVFNNINKIEDCKEKFIIFTEDLSKDTVIKKDDLCHDLISLNKCANQLLTSQCPKDRNLHNIVNKIHNAIISPCV